MLKIIVDGSGDMPADWVDTYQLNILPMPIQMGSETFYQGVDLDAEKFYALVDDQKQVPKTAAPSPERIKAFIEEVSEVGDTVLSINVSSQMSATLKMVENAARDLVDRITVIPFDSLAGSAVLGFMAREARLLERAGESLDVILERLEKMRKKALVVLTLDRLTFAYRSGRVNALKAALSSLLKIKPIVSLKAGLMEMSEIVRTRNKALDRLITRVVETFGTEPLRLAVVHARDEATASLLKAKLEQSLNVVEMVITDLSISVAANLGPGTVGIVALPKKL